ncbi:hypothetical protein [Niastella populi]|uniref:Outer membrane protein beta-barrel domain-containing protein n=1 Tax=Niastella populi TaxID=550983 RepID=A0A1V9F351_9BACT|nr:hypothetical protein [Niastella populi]OQP52702.1 hypothetical protein A4R26_28530 [Niastella populi]
MRAFASILMIALVFTCNRALAQSEVMFEQYHVINTGQPSLYMPVMHYQHSKNWYAEARYNYEDVETFSLYLGRAFNGGKNAFNYSVVPMLGGSLGRWQGISTGLNIDVDLNDFFFSSQSQYSRSTGLYGDYFVYNWSEVGYQSLKWLYAGLSLQHTHERFAGSELQPGFMVGFTFNRFTIPLYTFEPFNSGRNFIIGVTMEWTHKKRKQPALVKDETTGRTTPFGK